MLDPYNSNPSLFLCVPLRHFSPLSPPKSHHPLSIKVFLCLYFSLFQSVKVCFYFYLSQYFCFLLYPSRDIRSSFSFSL